MSNAEIKMIYKAVVIQYGEIMLYCEHEHRSRLTAMRCALKRQSMEKSDPISADYTYEVRSIKQLEGQS